MRLQTVPNLPWTLEVEAVASPGRGIRKTVQAEPPDAVEVVKLRIPDFPDYAEAWGGWQHGFLLPQLAASECSAAGALDPASLRLESESGELYEFGRDYRGDLKWGSIGRIPQGRIPAGATVRASYRCFPQRLDSVVLTASGELEYRRGMPHMATPEPPALQYGERRIGNIHFQGNPDRLDESMLYPVLEEKYPEEESPPGTAARLLPKTYAKLESGEPLRILAWGDSVTAGSYLAQEERWQEQTAARLREQFPDARIELLTAAWGGRCSRNFVDEPAGSPHCYREQVLGPRPDLIISEFVNDAGLREPEFSKQYEAFRRDFESINAEWLILAPHYIRPDWMELDRQKEIDDDPRPYVGLLRDFAAKHGIALADASKRYGRLWRQGIPYNTLMVNNINHPNRKGMKLFADAVLALFQTFE
ncbi:MAG: SGNH/GDSL hydrolase family protein [Lentisphaeria bacterium]|nr:SGNH/GDSL hydrolase family protein [Lentisphaeria bacterium]